MLLPYSEVGLCDPSCECVSGPADVHRIEIPGFRVVQRHYKGSSSFVMVSSTDSQLLLRPTFPHAISTLCQSQLPG